jgi:hypothetical protein
MTILNPTPLRQFAAGKDAPDVNTHTVVGAAICIDRIDPKQI